MSVLIALVGAVTGVLGFRSAHNSRELQRSLESQELLDAVWAVLDRSHEGWGIVQPLQPHLQELTIKRKIQRALQLTPSDPEVLLCRGTFFAVRGQSERAIEEFRKSLQVSGGVYPPARGGLALELAATGRLEEAIEELETAIETTPDAPLLHTNLCYVRWVREDLTSARASCRRALELDPRYVPAYSNYATVLLAEGNLALAGEMLDEALAINPHGAGLLFNRAVVYAHEGREEDARKALRKAFQSEPSKLPLWQSLVGGAEDAQAGSFENNALAIATDLLIQVE